MIASHASFPHLVQFTSQALNTWEIREHVSWRPMPTVGGNHIHPASRGVAAHTAGLFRSVRGAKGGFPPWGLPKLRIFTFPPRGGSPS